MYVGYPILLQLVYTIFPAGVYWIRLVETCVTRGDCASAVGRYGGHCSRPETASSCVTGGVDYHETHGRIDIAVWFDSKSTTVN